MSRAVSDLLQCRGFDTVIPPLRHKDAREPRTSMRSGGICCSSRPQEQRIPRATDARGMTVSRGLLQRQASESPKLSMTRRRWIADEVSGNRAFLLGENAEHLSRVLRARVGQQFEIATPDGVRLGEIVEIQAGRVSFSIRELPEANAATPSTAKIHLYLAIFKFDRFEWAIEKCTELGATSIVPTVTRRTDSHLVPAAIKRVERWRRIAHEAA